MMRHAFLIVAFLLSTLETRVALAGSEEYQVVKALVGQSVVLPCDVSSEMPCGRIHSIKWYKNEQRVYLYSELARIARTEGDFSVVADNRALFVTNSTPPYLQLQWTDLSDDALYRCEVTYLRIQESCPTVTAFNLTVLDPPSMPEVTVHNTRVLNGTTLQPINEGEDINITCASPGGKPAARISWWWQAMKSESEGTPTAVTLTDFSIGGGDEPVQQEDRGELLKSSRILSRRRKRIVKSEAVGGFGRRVFKDPTHYIRSLHFRVNGAKRFPAYDSRRSQKDSSSGRKSLSLSEILNNYRRSYNSVSSSKSQRNGSNYLKSNRGWWWRNRRSARRWSDTVQLPGHLMEIPDGKGRWMAVNTLTMSLTREKIGSRLYCLVTHEAYDKPISTWFQFDVKVGPMSVSLIGPTQAVTSGTQVTLNCVAVAARPAANITWYNGTDPIQGRGSRPRADLIEHVDVTSDGHSTYQTRSSITFNATRHEHGRNFTCAVMHDVWPQPELRTLALHVLYPPVVSILPHGNLTVRESDSITLTCDYHANPPNLTSVMWLRDGEPIVFISNGVKHNPNFIPGETMDGGRPQLTIRNVSRMEQGAYGCRLDNAAGVGVTARSAIIGIQHQPEVSLSISPSAVNETSSASVRLTCDITRANPRSLDRVKWYQDGKLLNETSGNLLVLSRVDRRQHGDYSCKGKNVAGWGVVSQAKNLVVNYPPGKARLSYEPTVVVKRKKITLFCDLEDMGQPPVTQFRWSRGSRVIKEVTSGNWTIDPVTLSTEGEISCLGVNEVGEGEQASVHINVQAPPMFINRLPHYYGALVSTSRLNLTCRVECDPKCEVEWLRNDELISPPAYRRELGQVAQAESLSSTPSDLQRRYIVASYTLPPDPARNDFQSVVSTLTWNFGPAWHGLDRYQDNANYTCRSTDNAVGPGVTSTTYFRVEYPPENISSSAPVLNVTEGELSSGVRGVRCKATSYPESTYTWYMHNKTVARGDLLTLPSTVSRAQGGPYTCVASNRHGNISTSVHVNVLYKPECQIEHLGTSKSRMTLSCRAQANPASNLHFLWAFGNSSLADDEAAVTRVTNSASHQGHHYTSAAAAAAVIANSPSLPSHTASPSSFKSSSPSILSLPSLTAWSSVGSQESVLTVPNAPAYYGTYYCAANNTVGLSSPCWVDATGWARADVQGWLEMFGDDNMLVISVVMGASGVLFSVLCAVLIIIFRKRRTRAKYSECNVELEDREGSDNLHQLPDGMAPPVPPRYSGSRGGSVREGGGLGEDSLGGAGGIGGAPLGEPYAGGTLSGRTNLGVAGGSGGYNTNTSPKCNGSEGRQLVDPIPSLYRQVCQSNYMTALSQQPPVKDPQLHDYRIHGGIYPANELHESPAKKLTLRSRQEAKAYNNFPYIVDGGYKVNPRAWASEHDGLHSSVF